MKQFLIKMALQFLIKTVAPYLIDQFEKFSRDLIASSRNAVSEEDVDDVVIIAKNNLTELLTKVGVDVKL